MSPSPSFSIIIVGAGIAGLAAAIKLKQIGHDVQVIERGKNGMAANRGGGLQLAPNAMRVIDGMGLHDRYREISDIHSDINVRRYDTGELLQVVHHTPPNSHVHRADLLDLLFDTATQRGVEIVLGKAVTALDDSSTRPIIHLEDGSSLECDLLIGADGIHSKIRRSIVPEPLAEPKAWPEATFLLDVPHSIMEKHPDTKELYDLPNSQLWFGPGRFIISWTMTRREMYHLQIVDHHWGAGKDAVGGWTQSFEDIGLLRRRWADFAPAIRQVLGELESCGKWEIAELEFVWMNERGNVILMGDAGHAIPPYAGQGAAQGLEDAAALAELISHATSPSDIPVVAKTFAQVRLPRVNGVNEVVRANVAMFSMPDGADQEERDQALKANGAAAVHPEKKVRGNSFETFDWIDGYDVVIEAREAWHKAHPDQTTS